jgi:hypothetical protein
MPATATTPSTASALLAALREYGPTVDGDELAFDCDPPAALVRVAAVLHTGVRALLTGRPWYGERSDRPGLTALNPPAPIPTGITLLCVEGDQRWHRVRETARVDLPALFTTVR